MAVRKQPDLGEVPSQFTKLWLILHRPRNISKRLGTELPGHENVFGNIVRGFVRFKPLRLRKSLQPVPV